MKICSLCIAILAVTACVSISPVQADIYVYRDSQGVLHFSNAPTSIKYRTYMSETDTFQLPVLPDAYYDDVISEAAKKNDLSFSLLKALIHVESYFDPHAVSKKGALGLMQIMPENLEPLNIDHPFDPRENIMGGASYLKEMLNRFGGKLELALAAYNAGPTVVEKYSDIPPYRETQEYVKKVLKLYEKYSKI